MPHLLPEQEELICQLIQCNPHLLVLRVGSYINQRAALLTVITDTTLPHLQELELFLRQIDTKRSYHPGPHTVRRFLENAPQSLRKIEVDLGYDERRKQ
ncbi:hypothetical protein BGZ52_004177, partial [Haplosporangium bisporale]